MKQPKWLTILLLSVLLFTFCAKDVSVEATIGSTTVYLYPLADSWVDSRYPDNNNGNDSFLVLHTNGYECYSYIMFDLSSIPSNAIILLAELRVRLNGVSGYGCDIGSHRSSDSSWKESELTWNNKPVFESQATATVKFRWPIVMTGYKYWNITSDVQAMMSTGKLTEVLVFDWSEQYTHAYFNSKEYIDSKNRPYLSIEYVTTPIYQIHLESIDDTSDISNIGSISIKEHTEILPKDVSVAGGSYNVTYNSGYKFIRWETVGGVKVSDASSQSTMVTVTGHGTLRAVGSSRRIEYLYDDGSSDASVGSARNPGDIAAVRFTPLITNKLLSVRFYFTYCHENTISVHVMDSAKSDLITAFDQTPTFEQPYSSHGWFNVDLSNYDITLNAGMDYYIGMEWKEEGYPSLGCDWSRWEGEEYDPAEDRSWIWNETNWEIVARNNYMIRTVVGVPKASTTISCSVSPSSITFDSELIVSGSLSPAQPGESIVLKYTKPDKSSYTKIVIAEADGSYSDTYVPNKVGQWNVEANWAGNEEYKEATSPMVPFTVIQASSTISCNVSPPTASFKAPIKISGLITPARAAVQVQIQYSEDNGNTWDDITYTITDSKGSYSFSWISPNVGTYLIRSYWIGDEGYTESLSPTQSLNVTKLESSINCYLQPTQLTLGMSTTIKGKISPSQTTLITICYSTDDGVTWIDLTQIPSRDDGSYSYTWTPSTEGSYHVKTKWSGDADIVGAESLIQTLSVTKLTSTTTSTPTSTTTPTETSITTSSTSSSTTSTTTQTTSPPTTTSITTASSTSTTSNPPTEVNLLLYALPLIIALIAAIIVVIVLLIILLKRRKSFQPPPPNQQSTLYQR